MTAVNQKTLPPIIKAASPEREAEMRAQIRKLVGARAAPFMRQLIGAWCVIIGAISLAIWLDNVWMSLATIFLVATRQNLLGLLVHEQVHRLGSRGRYGDLITNLFAAYPLLVLTVEGYAQVHLAHHKYFYTEKDPDYARKSGTEWSIPMSRGQFARMLLQDILGINIVRLIRSKKLETDSVRDEFRRRYPTPQWVRPTFWIVVAGALSYSGGWVYFLLYWILPLLTVAQCLVRLGALSEHKYNVNSTELNDSTHLIELSWWERALLPNMNFTLHHYHHMFPGLSFTTLPLVHRMYTEANLVHRENVLHGYADFIRRRILAK
ncbi:fatty acid desaturase [Nitrosospira sp. Is2]|nr:fatty acid desaturase [Nitrosospira sp. Is2]WON74972.1 fatty acid desaturase [Nitrosospira sp. Is2]